MNALEIKIQPTVDLIPAVRAAIGDYAKNFFTDNRVIQHLKLATEEALSNVLLYARTEQLNVVTITANAAGGEFTISVTDTGLLGDYNQMLNGEQRLGLELIRGVVNKVKVENLGVEGRRQTLTQYYSEPLSASVPEEKPAPAIIENAEITVRAPRPEELLDVCRGIYNEYGMTYTNDIIYYPERFRAAVESDALHSTVAVDQYGNIAGHHAAFEWETIPGVWESGMAVVSKSYRNAGIFNKMMERTYRYVHDEKQGRLFLGGCVTSHPYSQKLRLKCGSFPCGFQFNMAPPELFQSSFKKEQDFTHEALACSVFDFEPKTVWLPDEVRPATDKIYHWLELPRDIRSEPEVPAGDRCVLNTSLNARTMVSFGTMKTIGCDYADCLRGFTADGKRRGARVLTLYVPAEQAALPTVYEEAKKSGFFFTGLLPNTDLGDMLILQNMLTNLVDYDAQVFAEYYRELAEIVRGLDPYGFAKKLTL